MTNRDGGRRMVRQLLIALLTSLPLVAGQCWIRDLAAPVPENVWLLCEEGAVHHTIDGGRSWRDSTLSPAGGWHALAIVDATRAVAVGAPGRLAVTSDGGATWSPVGIKAGADLLAVASAGGQLWAAGGDGLILHSADGGNSWIRQSTYTMARLEGIFFRDTRHGWAVGWAGTILRTGDGGELWQTASPGDLGENFSAVWFLDERRGWVAGPPGLVLHTADGGITWEKEDHVPATGMVSAMQFLSPSRGVIASDRLCIYRDGKWLTPKPFRLETVTAASISGDTVWAAGPTAVFRSGDLGNKWSLVWRAPGIRHRVVTSRESRVTAPR